MPTTEHHSIVMMSVLNLSLINKVFFWILYETSNRFHPLKASNEWMDGWSDGWMDGWMNE